jgi:hypothetical protein
MASDLQLTGRFEERFDASLRQFTPHGTIRLDAGEPLAKQICFVSKRLDDQIVIRHRSTTLARAAGFSVVVVGAGVDPPSAVQPGTTSTH